MRGLLGSRRVPSTLSKPGDEDEARSILGTWETATSMLEKSTKREGLLLGSLRKHPEKAPPDMVVNWTPDGDTIRALGVPIGNDFSEHDPSGTSCLFSATSVA